MKGSKMALHGENRTPYNQGEFYGILNMSLPLQLQNDGDFQRDSTGAFVLEHTLAHQTLRQGLHPRIV